MTTTVTTSCLCIRRTGDVVPFNADKIALAMRKAFIAVQGESAGQSSRLRDEVARLYDSVGEDAVRTRAPRSGGHDEVPLRHLLRSPAADFVDEVGGELRLASAGAYRRKEGLEGLRRYPGRAPQ